MDRFHNNGGAIPTQQAVRRKDTLFDEAEKNASAGEPEVLRRVKMAWLAVQITALLHLEPDDPIHVKAERDIRAPLPLLWRKPRRNETSNNNGRGVVLS